MLRNCLMKVYVMAKDRRRSSWTSLETQICVGLPTVVSKPRRRYVCTAGACRTYSTTCAVSKVLPQCRTAVRT
jgi:hypothetical protein